MKRLVLSLVLVLVLAATGWGAELPSIPDGYEVVGTALDVCPSKNFYTVVVYEDKNGNVVFVYNDLHDKVILRAWHDSDEKVVKIETIDGNKIKPYGTHKAFLEDYPNAGCGILDARVRSTI